jgi:hypothetical protein
LLYEFVGEIHWVSRNLELSINLIAISGKADGLGKLESWHPDVLTNAQQPQFEIVEEEKKSARRRRRKPKSSMCWSGSSRSASRSQAA